MDKIIRIEPRSDHIELPDWIWPVLRDYNGFSGMDRIRGWQLVRWLQMAGMRPYAKDCRCLLTGMTAEETAQGKFPDPIVDHSENYYAPWEQVYTLTRSTHMKLHRRFKYPDEWRNYRDRNFKLFDQPNQKWLYKLSDEEIDYADILRDRYGQNTDNMMERFLAWLPKRAEELGMKSYPKPYGKLLTYEDFMYDDTRRTWQRTKFSERTKRAHERKKLREMGLAVD